VINTVSRVTTASVKSHEKLGKDPPKRPWLNRPYRKQQTRPQYLSSREVFGCSFHFRF